MRILDRYVLAGFLHGAVLGLVAFTSVFTIVDVFEKMDVFIDNHARALDIALYYIYKLPYVVALVLPIALLLAALLSLGQLQRQNELAAMTTSGVSLVRILRPVLLASAALSILSFAFTEFVVPPSNVRREEIFNQKIKKRRRPTGQSQSNMSYLGRGGRVYLARFYDAPRQRMRDFVVQEFEANTLTRRLDAREAEWDGKNWVLHDGYLRLFDGGRETALPFGRFVDSRFAEEPADFAKKEQDPFNMSLTQLRRYIDRVRESGGRAQKYLVEAQLKVSFPFTNLIIVLVGTSVGVRIRRSHRALGLGLALAIAFTYYGFLRVGQALGHSGVLPPFVAAWIGNLVFLLFGGYLLYRGNR
jgi:lipopolysaccharide export system permease protein